MFKKIISWVLSLWVAFVFIQSLFFKFQNHPDTQHIFNTISDWMAGNIFAFMADSFALYGGYVIGTVELIASVFLILPTFTRPIGGLLATGLMTGAIFFHIFTPLGWNVQGDNGLLFYMACSVWISGIIIFLLHRQQLRLSF